MSRDILQTQVTATAQALGRTLSTTLVVAPVREGVALLGGDLGDTAALAPSELQEAIEEVCAERDALGRIKRLRRLGASLHLNSSAGPIRISCVKRGRVKIGLPQTLSCQKTTLGLESTIFVPAVLDVDAADLLAALAWSAELVGESSPAAADLVHGSF